MNYIESLAVLRRDKDEFFKASAYSPLTPEQQIQFDRLRYYEPNPALDLTITVEPYDDPLEIPFATTSEAVQYYRRHGRFTFEVDGVDAQLTIYAGAHGYFLPFTDANVGVETYPAGRYLEPESLGNNRFHVDFNLAYNPYCAYGEPQALAVAAGREPLRWSCPITPSENRLQVAIRAGEKNPIGDWVEHE